MADNSSNSTHDVQGKPASHDHLATAAALARRGRFDQAIRWLDQALAAGDCSEAQVWDLKGRIFAQQGYYLRAEAAWQTAKRLDPTNPAYDQALGRLRSDRVGSVRLPLWLATFLGAATLSLLLWQVAFVNPNVVELQDAAEVSLMGIREAIAEVRGDTQSRQADFNSSFKRLDDRLSEIESGLSRQLAVLQTSSGNDRAMQARLSKKVDALGRSLEGMTSQLASSLSEVDLVRLRQLDAVRADVAALGDQLDSLQDNLQKKLDASEAAVHGDLKSLPKSAEVLALGESVSILQRQLDAVMKRIDELSKSPH